MVKTRKVKERPRFRHGPIVPIVFTEAADGSSPVVLLSVCLLELVLPYNVFDYHLALSTHPIAQPTPGAIGDHPENSCL
jgi:hypothetical protein